MYQHKRFVFISMRMRKENSPGYRRWLQRVGNQTFSSCFVVACDKGHYHTYLGNNGGGVMLIDCTHCQARINAEVLKLADYHDNEVWPDSYQLALLRCPECKHLLVGEQSLLEPPLDFEGIEVGQA